MNKMQDIKFIYSYNIFCKFKRQLALIKSLYIKYKMTDSQCCSCSCYRIYYRCIERRVSWSKLFLKSKMKVQKENPAKCSCKYRRNVK